MSVVELRREGDIAVVLVDNPPVNAQNNAVRAGLLDALQKAAADAEVKGIVLTCAGRTFVAGSDISEFGKVSRPPSTIAASIQRGRGGPHAPAKAVQALRDALALPVAQALERERATFMELSQSQDSKALRHVFFAEREAAKIPDIPAGAKTHDVRRAAV